MQLRAVGSGLKVEQEVRCLPLVATKKDTNTAFDFPCTLIIETLPYQTYFFPPRLCNSLWASVRRHHYMAAGHTSGSCVAAEEEKGGGFDALGREFDINRGKCIECTALCAPHYLNWGNGLSTRG